MGLEWSLGQDSEVTYGHGSIAHARWDEAADDDLSD